MQKRPHIIIFNPDEMRADAMSHLGNPAAVTPVLDAFAAQESVSFRHAYCQNPVCVPSRCSFFTGLYPHVNGHRSMGHLLHAEEDSLFRELKNAGYYVWMNDRNDLVAGQIPGLAESHATEIYYSGQKKQGPGPENPGLRGKPGDKNFYSHLDGKLRVNADGINYSGDDEIVDAAIQRIHNRPEDQPLCMFLGLFYPHAPYRVEDPYYSMIDRSKLPHRIRPEECTGKSKMISEIRKNLAMDAYTESDWDELRAIYLGMCAKVDRQFGKLVQALKDEGIYDDCAIFFLSDHGDFTGDYGVVEKAQSCFEECLTNVPLLIKPPKGYALDAGISDSLVELVDFYATAMEMAGVAPSHSHFGRSLTGILENRNAVIRPFVCCEGGRLPGETHCDEYHGKTPGSVASPNVVYWPKMKAQSDDEAHAKGAMLRNDRYKYICRITGEDEMYDLIADPQETTNRINDPALQAVLAEMRIQLMRWMLATADVVPLTEDARFTPEMLWARARSMVPKEYEADVREKIARGMPFPELMGYCRRLGEKHG